MRRHALRLLALLAVAALALTAAGCGGDDTALGQRDPGTVRVGEFSWSAASLTNAILQRIVADHPELGVKRLERVDVTPEDGWSGVRHGDLDLLTEVYLPNQAEYLDQSGDETELVHRTYAGAVSGWFVPAYSVEAGGPAAGLRSVDQLKRFGPVFGDKLYDGENGWTTTEMNADRIKGFSLPLHQVKESESTLISRLRSAYAARKPILMYLWRPHWVNSTYKLVMLDEPNGYSTDCFSGGSREACALPTNDVWTAGRIDLAARYPKFHRMLEQFELPIGDIERMLLDVEQRGRPTEEVAKEWVDGHRRLIDDWVSASAAPGGNAGSAHGPAGAPPGS